MTGLVAGKDKIIEIAAIITDKDLVPLEEEGFERIIHCDEEIMNGMDEWCTEHHRDVSTLPISPAIRCGPGGI
jgi:oligoribonuclease